jgi:glycosyltransferase involved in cell wall biosynthesis
MGYPEEDYIEQAGTLGLDDCITFTGKLDYSEAARYLNLGDIAVSPKLSATEANGKLLNYMACGLPCVVFDNQVNRELLGECGLYVQKQEPSVFADTIQNLFDDPGLQQDLSVKVRNHVINHHSWDARIVELESIYSEMLCALGSQQSGDVQ